MLAATDLASVEGLEALTIGRLAGALGISKSGLFAHFGSKRELQLATVERAREVFLEQVVRPALGEPRGLARLRALLEAGLAYMERPVFPGGCFFANTSAEFDSRPGARLAFELHALGLAANWCAQLLGAGEAFA